MEKEFKPVQVDTSDIDVNSPIGKRVFAQRLKAALATASRMTRDLFRKPQEEQQMTPEEIKMSLVKSSQSTRLGKLVS